MVDSFYLLFGFIRMIFFFFYHVERHLEPYHNKDVHYDIFTHITITWCFISGYREMSLEFRII